MSKDEIIFQLMKEWADDYKDNADSVFVQKIISLFDQQTKELQQRVDERDKQLSYCHKRMGNAYSEIHKLQSRISELEKGNNEDEEDPMNNLKDRMRKTYPEIFKTLDFNYKQERNVTRTIYAEFFYAFQKLGLDIIIDYSKANYNPYILWNHKTYIVSGNYEFDQTVRMACIEKCFEIIESEKLQQTH